MRLWLRPRGIPPHAVEEERGEAVGELVRRRSGAEPGVRPVDGREREPGRGRVVEVCPQVAAFPAVAEERAESVLVAAPLGEEDLAALSLQIAPFTGEDRGDVELLRDDAEVAAQG